jgi:hypothetical protein
MLAACCALLIMIVPDSFYAQGRYRGNKYSKADVDRIIKRVEESSDNFTKAFDKNLDRSRLDGSSLEDKLNRQVRQLERELDDLRRDFDRKDNWLETRDNVQDVIREADEVNRLMRTSRLGRDVETKWLIVKRDLNKLAGIYNIKLLK